MMIHLEPLLLTGEIILTHRLVDASNATLLGEIQNFGKVIYKPIAGERPLWDFSEGTLAYREVASFLLSDYLDLNLVPETVLRDGPFGQGAVQRWIEADPQVDPIEYAQSDSQALRLLALFDVIINNTDRKFGHILIDKEKKLYGCDHGLTFHTEDKLRTVLWQFTSEEFNQRERDLLEKCLNESHLIRSMLEDLLTEQELDAFFKRVETLNNQSTFPVPNENWPAVPWPPV